MTHLVSSAFRRRIVSSALERLLWRWWSVTYKHGEFTVFPVKGVGGTELKEVQVFDFEGGWSGQIIYRFFWLGLLLFESTFLDSSNKREITQESAFYYFIRLEKKRKKIVGITFCCQNKRCFFFYMGVINYRSLFINNVKI